MFLIDSTIIVFSLLLYKLSFCIALQPINTGSFKQEKSEKQYEEWLKNYKAPNPKHQDYCSHILRTKDGSASQYSQDLFIFFNFFKYWPMQGKVGFYVDSGANDAVDISNTYFFDVCLGWSGLCVEPEEQYHQGISENRTCHLIPECISDTDRNVDMSHLGPGSFITSKSGNIKCSTLSNMLSRVQKPKNNLNISNYMIDLWSLDVEGHEITVLKSINFNEIHIRILLIEEMWLVTRNLDRLMNDVGYSKYQQLPLDALYIHRSLQGPVHPWYQTKYEEHWKGNDMYRQFNRGKIQCE